MTWKSSKGTDGVGVGVSVGAPVGDTVGVDVGVFVGNPVGVTVAATGVFVLEAVGTAVDVFVTGSGV